METAVEVQCRPACHRDCDATMAINRNIYGGLDYLQHKFHNFVDDPLRFPYVALINGTIVGFKSGYVIDDGTSLVSEAIRVHPDHQRKGVMKKLDQVVFDAAKTEFPLIERVLWTAVDLETSLSIIKKNSAVKLLVTRPRVTFDSTCDLLNQLCASQTFVELIKKYKVPNILAVPRRLAIDILSNHTDFEDSVPEGMMIVNFAPWGLHKRTFIELVKYSSLHITNDVQEVPGQSDKEASPYDYYSPLSGVDGTVVQVADKFVKTERSVSTFSFHSVSTTKNGARCRVDFYCPVNAENKIALAISHLLYHIREFTECHQNTDVSFSMLFGEHVDQPELKRFLTEELGLHRDKSPEFAGLLLSMSCTGTGTT